MSNIKNQSKQQYSLKSKTYYRLRLHHLMLAFLLIASTFQYGDYIVSRNFIPHISVLICLFYFLTINFRLDSVEQKILSIHFLFILAFLILSAAGLGDIKEFFFDFAKLPLVFFTSFIVFYLVKNSQLTVVYKYTNIMFVFVIVFLILELFYRVIPFVDNFDLVLNNFYVMKVNSIFMYDSNLTALYALFYYILAVFLLKTGSYDNKKYLFFVCLLLLFFMVLTFSRSVIIISALITALVVFNNFKRIYKYILFPFLFVMGMLVFYNIYIYVTTDGSGLTKLNVLLKSLVIIQDIDLRGLLFGFGHNEGGLIYSYKEEAYSHLLIPLLLGQFGLIGLTLYFVFFYIMYRLSAGKNILLILAMFIAGLSLLPSFLETVFLVNGFILGLHYNKELAYGR